MLSESDIHQIASRVQVGFAPMAVGIFGSYAIGRAHDASDLDIIVIKRSSMSKYSSRQRVKRLLFGVVHPLDVHVYNPDEFEQSAQDHLSFEWVIARQTKLYFAATELFNSVPCLRRDSV